MKNSGNGDLSGLRKLARFGSAGMAAGLALAVCVVGGHFADKYFGTHPWLIITGIVVGLVTSFVTLIRSALRDDGDGK